ncbi:hypothetical protein COV20_02065 [Candidatus Woesearchaeota archaeon CG10_big_fil_rev_8_21_14_0_10_45_16]|nr:MAG: hypothetical protein COV20_02065 [Candidatus Woesearchaeota archaeon CG10_big_fil_rev_8_21_14_0_10_45_16]
MYAASTARADKINYYQTAENHTITITNDEGSTTSYNFTLPTGWAAFASSTCSVNATGVNCNGIANGGTALVNLTNPTSDFEYTVTTVDIHGGSTNDVKFLMINPSEIFHTLVEYGRGRGNYFFDSATSGNTSGSGATGTGTTYLPNGTDFELNYLHKVLNIRQYYGFSSSLGENATWTCVYPNQTSVRQHQAINISRGLNWTVTYQIDEIGGSWERMGYFGQRFGRSEYPTGQNITVNCTDLKYTLTAAGGNVSVGEGSFILQFRSRTPFTVFASSSSTINNGTQEVEITYNINNTEIYTADSPFIEIQSPKYATFIGTRGELWGSSRDRYVLESTEMSSGGSEQITLVARFDTSTVPSTVSAVNLSRGVNIRFIAPWEANAYNPQEYIQEIPEGNIGTTSFNLGVQTSIVAVQSLLSTINETSFFINTTSNTLENIIRYVNETRWNQTTAQDIIDAIISNTSSITTNNSEIMTQLERMREFDEELVFLVTDSFGLQEQAREQARAGDRDGALDSLRQANEKLREAADRLENLDAGTDHLNSGLLGVSSEGEDGVFWFWFMFFIIVSCVVIYLLVLKRSHRKQHENVFKDYQEPDTKVEMKPKKSNSFRGPLP